jgi:hypothetical protein
MLAITNTKISAVPGVIMPVMHLFPKFPTEIQLKIWGYTFPNARVINIRYDSKDDAYTSSATPPVALFVCKQSRDEAKRFWKLTFGKTVNEGRIWINFDIDPVLFTLTSDGRHVMHRQLRYLDDFASNFKGIENIKVLALPCDVALHVHVARGPDSEYYNWLAEQPFYDLMLSLEQVWAFSAFDDSRMLDIGESGYVISKSKFSTLSSDDVSLVPFLGDEPDVWRKWWRGSNPKKIVWGGAKLKYQNLNVLAVDHDFKPGGIRRVVKLDRKRGLTDPTYSQVFASMLLKRFIGTEAPPLPDLRCS